MGKKALRKQASVLLKKHGSKLYRNFNVAREKLSAQVLKRIIAQHSVNVGDIIFDCDGFNHRVKSIQYKYCRTKHHARGYWSGPWVEFEFEDGGFSCSCDRNIQPISREKIEKELLEFMKISEYTKIDHKTQVIHVIENGQHVVDEHGILLPKFLFLK